MVNNPYQQPSADLVPEQVQDGMLAVNPPRARDIGAGWRWFPDAWRVFKSAWGTIFLALIVAFVLSMVAQFVPVLGVVLGVLIAPFLSGGLVLLLYKADEQRGPTVGDLFTPFSTHFTPLLVLGLLYLAMLIGVMVIVGIVGAVLFGDMLNLVFNNMAALEQGQGMQGFNWQSLTLLFLIMAALMIPVMATYWFAPALVVLGNQRPVEALKASLIGCLKNILPMLWYSVIMLLLLLVALIPAGLGLLLVLPILTVTYYSSFRDIYTDTL